MTVIKCSKVACSYLSEGICSRAVVEIEFEKCTNSDGNLYRCECCGKRVLKIYENNRCYDCQYI